MVLLLFSGMLFLLLTFSLLCVDGSLGLMVFVSFVVGVY